MQFPIVIASTATTAFAATASLIAIAMSLSTLERYLTKHRPYELAWTFALAMFAVASLALAIGSRHGWNGTIFRTFFLFGAVINVPVLALGSLLLHARDNTKVQKIETTVIVAFVFFSIGVIISTPFTHTLPLHALAKGSKVFDALPRILAGVGSGVSALIIAGLALKSAFRGNNKRFLIGNALIALGTAITGASGLLNSVLGEMQAFAITLALGIAVIFLGFLAITTPSQA